MKTDEEMNTLVNKGKWCLKVTTENKSFLRNLENRELHFQKGYNYSIDGYYSSVKNNGGWGFNSIPNDFTEITLEQFKKYVLKEEYVFPEFWQIDRNKENSKVINDWMNNHHATKASQKYSDSLGFVNNKTLKKGKEEDIPIISFEQFNKYVMKKEEEFVFPKQWYIKVTKENIEALGKWRSAGAGGEMAADNPTPTGYITSNDGYWSCYKPTDSTEITFAQFKQYVLKEKPVIKEEFVLPVDWYLAVTPENKGVIENWRPSGTISGDSGLGYVRSSPLGYWTSNVPSGCTEITFEQFNKYILKQEKVMEKKIIGYLAPYDINYFVKTGTKYVTEGAGYCPEKKKGCGSEWYLPAQLVETWEPVYKEEFKVGDYVCENWNASPDKTKAYVINRIKDNNIYYNRNDNGSLSHASCRDFRMATPEEIQKAKDEELLAEAKKRYPIGTKFYPAHVSPTEEYCIVTNDIFKIKAGHQGQKIAIVALTDCGNNYSSDEKYGNTCYDRVVYGDKGWAEIIKAPVFPNVTIKGYTAELRDNGNVVKFGCQEYSKEFVLELSSALENNDFSMECRTGILKLAEYFNAVEE